jgi:pimeloyl-ACP methyl ester carboxylesterase
VLLCHGFPESWYSWRYQLKAFAQAGYRAVAPDMRGYGHPSPPGTSGAGSRNSVHSMQGVDPRNYVIDVGRSATKRRLAGSSEFRKL